MEDPINQNDKSQSINLNESIINSQIQKSIDLLNEILDTQDEILDQGLLDLPESLDEKVNSIDFEPIKIIGQKIINSRKKLNDFIKAKINLNDYNPNDDNKLLNNATKNDQLNYFSSSIISIDPIKNSTEMQEENANKAGDDQKKEEDNDKKSNHDRDNDEKEDESKDNNENNSSIEKLKSSNKNAINDEYSGNSSNNEEINENESKNDQISSDNAQYYDNYEIIPRQRSSSAHEKCMIPNGRPIPPLSPNFNNHSDNDIDTNAKLKQQANSPTQILKIPPLSKMKAPSLFRSRERALSTLTSSNLPLLTSSVSLPTTPQMKRASNQFVNDEEKVKKISDSCFNPLPNFASICSTIEKIDKTLSDYNKTKFDQFANAETRLKNISRSIHSFIRVNNKIEQNLKQIISDSQIDSEKDETSYKDENEFLHIKKNIQSLLLIKEGQNKKIKQQAKEINNLKSQIESLRIFIKNNQKQIAKFKQQFYDNLTTDVVNDGNNENKVEVGLHFKQRSKSIDFFNSFLFDDESDFELSNYCNQLRMTNDDANLHEMVKQIDQLLCTIDNEEYEENADVEFRLEKLRERVSKLYMIDEDQITKNWTLICAEGAEIDNPEIRSFFFEKQFSETQAKLLSLEKQRTKLFELFFSFSNNKSKRDFNNDNNDNEDDDEDDEMDDYITNTISESILDDLNEKNLTIDKLSKIIVDLKKDIETKNKNSENLTKKLNKQAKENKELIRKYEEISNKFSESETKLNQRMKEIRSLNRKKDSDERKIVRLERRIDEINELNKKNGSITEIKNISNSLIGELSSMKLLADQQEKAISELHQIKEQLEDELEASNEALKDSMIDIQEKTESLKNLESQLQEEKENLKLKDVEINEVKSLLEHQVNENEKLNETIKVLTNSSVQDENDNDKIEDKGNLSIIGSLKKQVAALTEENEKKELQIKDLNKQILSSEPRLYSLRRKSVSQRNIINELTGKNEKMKNSIESKYQEKIDKLNERIAELESQLQNAGNTPNIETNNNQKEEAINNETKETTKSVQKESFNNKQKEISNGQGEESLNNDQQETTRSVQKESFNNKQKEISNGQGEESLNNDQQETTRSVQKEIFNNEQKEKSDVVSDYEKIESEMKRELLRLAKENDELKRINEEMKSHIENKEAIRTKAIEIDNEKEISTDAINGSESNGKISSSSNRGSTGSVITSDAVVCSNENNDERRSSRQNEALLNEEDSILMRNEMARLSKENEEMKNQIQSYQQNSIVGKEIQEMRESLEQEYQDKLNKMNLHIIDLEEQLQSSRNTKENSNSIENVNKYEEKAEEAALNKLYRLRLENEELKRKNDEMKSQLAQFNNKHITENKSSSDEKNYAEQAGANMNITENTINSNEMNVFGNTHDSSGVELQSNETSRVVEKEESIHLSITEKQKENEIARLSKENEEMHKLVEEMKSQIQNYQQNPIFEKGKQEKSETHEQEYQDKLNTKENPSSIENAHESENKHELKEESALNELDQLRLENEEHKRKNEEMKSQLTLFNNEGNGQTEEENLNPTKDKEIFVIEEEEENEREETSKDELIVDCKVVYESSSEQISSTITTNNKEETPQTTGKDEESKHEYNTEILSSNASSKSIETTIEFNHQHQKEGSETSVSDGNNQKVSSLEKRIAELEEKNSREVLYETFLSSILGENVTMISEEQLISRIESFQISESISSHLEEGKTKNKKENDVGIENMLSLSQTKLVVSSGDFTSSEENANISDSQQQAATNMSGNMENKNNKNIYDDDNNNNVRSRSINITENSNIEMNGIRSTRDSSGVHLQYDEASLVVQKEEELLQCQKEIFKLTSANDRLKQENERLSSQLSVCEGELHAMQTQMSIVVKLFGKQEYSQNHNVALNSEEFSQIIEKLKSENEEPTHLSITEKQKENEMRNEVARLSKENEEMHKLVREMERQSSVVESEIQEMRRSIESEYQDKLDKMNLKIIDLDQQEQYSGSTKEKAKENENRYEAALNELDRLRLENEELKRKNDEMKSQLTLFNNKQITENKQNNGTENTSNSNEMNVFGSTHDSSGVELQSNETSRVVEKEESIHLSITEKQKENEIARLSKENEEMHKLVEEMKSQIQNYQQNPIFEKGKQEKSETHEQEYQDKLNTKENPSSIENAHESENKHELKEESALNELDQLRLENEEHKRKNEEMKSQLALFNNEGNKNPANDKGIFVIEEEEENEEDKQNTNNEISEAEQQQETFEIEEEEEERENDNSASPNYDSEKQDFHSKPFISVRDYQLRIWQLEKENEKLMKEKHQFNNSEEKLLNTEKVDKVKSLLLSPIFEFTIASSEIYDDKYTICIPSLSTEYGYDSNRFSYNMSEEFGPVLSASLSTVFMPNDQYLTFGFVNFTSRKSDIKLFERNNNDNENINTNDCYYLKSQVIVTNLPFGIKKSEVMSELSKFAPSLSINFNGNNVKNVFYEDSINPEYLIDFKNNVDDAQTFVEAIQNRNINDVFSYHMSGYIPIAFYYDPCPFKMNENRQKAIGKFSSNARLIAMMEPQQFQVFDFNSYFSGLINKSENDAIYRPQIVSNENHDNGNQFRLIVDRRFVVTENFPKFRKFEVVFTNDLEAVMAQTFALNYNCDILQIFHSNFQGNRIAGNDF